MIQEFKTSKGEFLLVKVPDDAKTVHIAFNSRNPTLMWCTDLNGIIMIQRQKLEKGNWQIVGEAFDLTRDRCREIIIDPDTSGLLDIYKNYRRHQEYLTSAKQSFESLLVSLDVYSENPIPMPEFQSDENGNGGYCESWINTYQEAEQRTGRWILLKKIS